MALQIELAGCNFQTQIAAPRLHRTNFAHILDYTREHVSCLLPSLVAQ
jgi:hypothetical protein